MHKKKNTMSKISLLLILGTCVTLIHAHRGFGPPPPGYFGRSRSPPPPPQSSQPSYYGNSPQQRNFESPSYYGPSSSSSSHPPQQYHHNQPHYGASQSQPSYKKPPQKSNIMGWLGSQMAKNFQSMTGFNRGSGGRHPTSQKYKQAYGRSPPPSSSSVMAASGFGTPSPSGFGGGGATINSISASGGQGGGGVSHMYFPPGSPPTPYAGMTPQNTIFQVISADGSSRYQASPPPGYENFFNQQGVLREALSQSSASPPPYQQQQHAYQPHQPQQQQQPQYPQHTAPITYQYQNAPGQQPLHGTKSTGNIEVFPSQMVSYEKQTLSTGHPEYQAAVDGMITAASTSNANGYPVYYQLQQPIQQSQPLPQFYSQLPQQQQQYRMVQSIPSSSPMMQGVSANIAPILDLSTIQHQQQDMASAASTNSEHQQQQVMEEVQQQQHSDYQQQQENQSPSISERQDVNIQSDYSHNSGLTVISPPTNFQYQTQMDNHMEQGQIRQEDLQGAESSNYPQQNQNHQIQIVNQGSSSDGNPMFEVMADANAPTYGQDGHPFDINQLIGMIEPGAQVDPKDIVSEAQENGGEQAQPPQGFQQEYDRIGTTTTTQQ